LHEEYCFFSASIQFSTLGWVVLHKPAHKEEDRSFKGIICKKIFQFISAANFYLVSGPENALIKILDPDPDPDPRIPQ
jgi:hypothetical protein